MCQFKQRLAWIAIAVVSLSLPTFAQAQQRERTSKTDAPLVVDGTVRQAYRGAAQGQGDALLQVEVSRAEARKAETNGSHSHYPAPGESVYVHVAQQDGGKDLPAAGAQIRAYLTPTEKGGWAAASADWYEALGTRPSGIDPADLAREAVEAAKNGSSLGLTTEPLKVEGRTVLRVTSVARGGAAQNSGLEVGDIIAAVDGAPIGTPDQLSALAAKGKTLSLVVVDVNTGRAARVEVDPQAKPAPADAADKTETPSAPPAQPARVSLGLSAEPVTLGTRSALKVIRVDPAGAAAKAKIEPGDIIVSANGAPTTGVEQLMSVLRKSGPLLKLVVRDTNTGRDVNVDVNLGGVRTTTTSDVEPPIKSNGGKLGAVTELVFHDSDFAVKVTEVEPGSAAARAGLRPGVLIVAADGKPVLHPNDLNDAVRNSKGTLRLSTEDPSSGKKSNVDLSLR